MVFLLRLINIVYLSSDANKTKYSKYIMRSVHLYYEGRRVTSTAFQCLFV